MYTLHRRLRWYRRLTIFFAILSAALIAHETKLFLERPRFEFDGGHAARSPDGRWSAYLESMSVPLPKRSKWDPGEWREYMRLQLFDLTLPENSDLDLFPTRKQEHNPTASILVPLRISARSSTLEWNAAGDVLRIAKPDIGSDSPATVYEFHIKTMSWVKITADPPPAAPAATGAVNQAASLDELLLFFPAKYPVGNWKPDRLRFEDVSFQAADGTELHGWFCPCDRPKAVVLFCHGNGGNLATRLERLEALQLDQHVSVFIFDYRGYGRSAGSPSVAGILQDARAARKVAAERAGVEASQLVLLGESLGGAVAVDLAAEFGARGLILENTFASLAEVASVHYPQLAWLVPADKLNSAASLVKYRGPLLQCHGDADETIPFTQGKKLFATAHEPKRFVGVAGGRHNDPPSAEYLRELERFFEELSKR